MWNTQLWVLHTHTVTTPYSFLQLDGYIPNVCDVPKPVTLQVAEPSNATEPSSGIAGPAEASLYCLLVHSRVQWAAKILKPFGGMWERLNFQRKNPWKLLTLAIFVTTPCVSEACNKSQQPCRCQLKMKWNASWGGQ